MENKPIEIVLRPMREGDTAFVYATWLQSYRYASKFAADITDDVYFARHRQVLQRVLGLENTKVVVAVDPERDDQIFGYAVVEAAPVPILHFVFVKKPFRRFGVARALLGEMFGREVWVSHLTHLGKRLLPKEWCYNPYLV